MRAAIWALCLLLTPAFVLAAPCTNKTPPNVPCTPVPGEATDDAKKNIIGFIKFARGLTDDVKKLKAEFIAVRDNPKATAQEKFDACVSYRNAKLEQDDFYRQAIEQTSDLYHVKPDHRDRITIGEPDEQNKKYMTGLSAIWNPQVTESGPVLKFSIRIDGNDRLPHHSGATQMDPLVPDGRQAITTLDGRVFILEDTFELALQKNNIGFLAHTLYHETRHFNRLSWTDKKGKNRSWATTDEEERDAYEADARMGKVFGLKQTEIDEFRTRSKAYGDAVKNGVPITDDHLTPQQEAVWRNHYEHLQLNLDEEYAAVQKAVQDEKAAQEALRKRLDEERLARERAAKEYEERRSRAHREEIDSEAALCGHRMHYDTDNKTMLGFGSFWLSRYQVPFDFVDMKVVFLMTRACQDIEYHPDRPAPVACNASAPLLKERVARGDFAAKLKYLTGTDLGAYSENSECMKNILANANRITDDKSFNDVTSTFQKQLSKRRGKEAKRDRERSEGEKKDGARDNQRGPIETAPDRRHYYWDPGCNCRIYVD
ncbi:MAG: hypothetical protein HY923_10950 [Elusimicrobia bacterium]|nr:hypothetical protein [Elusimicrobiota bacterium]